MNSKQKIILLIGVVLILAGVGYWQLSGGEILSKDGIWVEKEQTDLDKLLGLDPEMEFKEKFIWGLVPHTLGFTAIIGVITLILLFITRKKKAQEKK